MKNSTADKSTYLYRYYDRFGTLLYVGITDNPEQRSKTHASTKFWWNDVADKQHMAFETREQALWAEWAVITTCHPLHNAAAVLPAKHRCAEPAVQVQPTAFDGYISVMKQLAKIEADQPVYQRLHQRTEALIAEGQR